MRMSMIRARTWAIFVSTAYGLTPVIQAAADGCALLEQQVRQQVLSDAGEPAIRLRRSEPGALRERAFTVCPRTAHTVTAAFGSALRELGLIVTWSPVALRPADYCEVNDIRTCEPVPAGPQPPDDSQLTLIDRTWAAIRTAVLACMPWGSESDVSQISEPGCPEVR